MATMQLISPEDYDEAKHALLWAAVLEHRDDADICNAIMENPDSVIDHHFAMIGGEATSAQIGA